MEPAAERLLNNLRSGNVASTRSWLSQLGVLLNAMRPVGKAEAFRILMSQSMYETSVTVANVPASMQSSTAMRGPRGGAQVRHNMVWFTYATRVDLANSGDDKTALLRALSREELTSMSADAFFRRFNVTKTGRIDKAKQPRVTRWPYMATAQKPLSSSSTHWRWLLWFLTRYVPWSCATHERVSAIPFFLARACHFDPTFALPAGFDAHVENDALSRDLWPRVFNLLLQHYPDANTVHERLLTRGRLLDDVGSMRRQRHAAQETALAGPAAAADGAEEAAVESTTTAAFAEMPFQADGSFERDVFAVPSHLVAKAADWEALLALTCLLQGMSSDDLHRLVTESRGFFPAVNANQPANPSLPDSVPVHDLDIEQQFAYDLLFTDLVRGRSPLPSTCAFAGFDIRALSGSAGSGKSQLVNKAHRALGDRVVCMAFTGTAAANIYGCTVHHYFGLDVGDDDDAFAASNKRVDGEALRKLCEKLGGVTHMVVDEMGMVPLQLFEVLMQALTASNRHQDIRICLVGDFSQLPPIPPRQLWRAQGFEHWLGAVISRSYRVANPEFAAVLEKLRSGTMDVAAYEYLKRNTFASEQQERLRGLLNAGTTHIVPTNEDVLKINVESVTRFASYPRRPVVLSTRKMGKSGKVKWPLAVGVPVVCLNNFARLQRRTRRHRVHCVCQTRRRGAATPAAFGARALCQCPRGRPIFGVCALSRSLRWRRV